MIGRAGLVFCTSWQGIVILRLRAPDGYVKLMNNDDDRLQYSDNRQVKLMMSQCRIACCACCIPRANALWPFALDH